jgi:hypothetical protein
MQQGLAAEWCNFVRHVLRRRGNFQDDTHFVGEMFQVGLKTPHHSVDTVGAKNKAIRTIIRLVAQHMSYALLSACITGDKMGRLCQGFVQVSATVPTPTLPTGAKDRICCNSPIVIL